MTGSPRFAICSAMAVFARAMAPYAEAARLVEAWRYEEATEMLQALDRAEPGNPDVLNLLGYAARQRGETEAAENCAIRQRA